jgi:hypothetical protein
MFRREKQGLGSKKQAYAYLRLRLALTDRQMTTLRPRVG